ncbi:hypothetical protein GCM10007891_09830 [Methylophaga thalassica]|uniref:Uncharacterized protein n=1 Tax=Methylophaga thalassica TaxID=40223 RepID=A0ABQ5TT35_9GAMM|nr:hypothetical protein [Methylophaga thalassica]GLP99129.1 hypothetical protein GCM10007891_09830 [Methylophaga thalassica]
MDMHINQESKPSKLAAVFDDEQKAIDAKQTLVNVGHFKQQDIEVIQPKDRNTSKKIESEPKAIARFITRSHFIFGGVGLLVGLVIASAMVVSGPMMTQSSPLHTYIALAVVGTFVGLLFAGLLSLRPDHDPLINDTVTASRHNLWTLIVQTDGRKNLKKAHQLMNPTAVSVTETF